MNEHALSRRPELLVAAAGLGVGIATAIGQTYLDGALNALVNSVSAWLVAAFLVGSRMRSDRGAMVAGLCVCALQLVGYYAIADLRGFPLGGTALIVFWFGCAVAGGPVFGLAGRRWRLERPRGLGAAILASAFFAEGLWTYAHEQHRYGTAALWLAIGSAIAVALTRDRRWLLVTVPAALVGELLLSWTIALT